MVTGMDMTEERLLKMKKQLFFKIEDVVAQQVPSKRARFAADLDAITAMAAAIAVAPVLHTLQAAAEVGFAQAGLRMNADGTIPPVPSEQN
jgi:hypothetical protein